MRRSRGQADHLLGNRFGRLIVEAICWKQEPSGQRHLAAVCSCDCTNSKVIRITSLEREGVQSCGCLRKERAGAAKRESAPHGHARKGKVTPTFRSWVKARERCLNPHDKKFADYGGRGVGMCQRWIDSFANFLADMGEKPLRAILDRIEVNGNYSPENCRWTNQNVSRLNQRRTKFYEFGGEQLSLYEISARTGIKIGTLWWRAKNGKPLVS